MDKIKWMIVWLLLVCSMAGCGKPEDREYSDVPKDLESELSANVTYENLDQEELSDVSLATVQIVSGSNMGSGVIYKETSDEWIILTAGHVIADEDNVFVSFSDGAGAKCEKVITTKGSDLLFLRMKKNEMDLSDKICSVSVDKEAYDQLRVTDFVKAVGSYHGVAEDICEGIITDKLIYAESLGEMVIMTDMKCFAGMSGSGVYDDKGNFLGIVCALNETEGTAVIPLITIMAKAMEVL